MHVLVILILVAGTVLGLLASVGVGALGPFATAPLATVCLAGALALEVIVYGRRPIG